jgi:hypothetical protein
MPEMNQPEYGEGFGYKQILLTAALSAATLIPGIIASIYESRTPRDTPRVNYQLKSELEQKKLKTSELEQKTEAKLDGLAQRLPH